MSEKKYDSTPDTLKHILLVQKLMLQVINELSERARVHDQSKFESPEKELFDEYTPILEKLPYGSPEYKKSLEKLKPALDHHYENNSHHPEHFKNGIDGMSLLDLIEALVDWKAATKRTKDGDIKKSLEISKKRFKISDQLYSILENTVKELGFDK